MRIKLKCQECGRHQLHTVALDEGSVECGACHAAIRYRVKRRKDASRDLFGGGGALDALKQMFGGLK